MSTSVAINTAAPSQAGGMRPHLDQGPGQQVRLSNRGEHLQIQEVAREISAARSSNAPTVHEVSKISRESVEAAAQKIQSFISSMKRDLNIYVDNSTGRAVIRVVDPESSQLIRQIPPEESIRLAQTVDFLSSLLVHQRA